MGDRKIAVTLLKRYANPVQFITNKIGVLFVMSNLNLSTGKNKMTHSNLVPVFNGTIALQPVQLCNARELHQFLESDQQFADWIKKRIEDYGFVENEDYIKLSIKAKGRGRSRTEYHITLDMGKELAMVERNDKGRQIRKYFIACEKALQNTNQIQPLIEKKYPFDFTEYELEQLVWLWCSHKQMNELLSKLEKPLEAIGSRFSPIVYSHHHEYKRFYDEAKNTIQRLVEPFQKSERLNWTRAINIINREVIK